MNTNVNEKKVILHVVCGCGARKTINVRVTRPILDMLTDLPHKMDCHMTSALKVEVGNESSV